MSVDAPTWNALPNYALNLSVLRVTARANGSTCSATRPAG